MIIFIIFIITITSIIVIIVIFIIIIIIIIIVIIIVIIIINSYTQLCFHTKMTLLSSAHSVLGEAGTLPMNYVEVVEDAALSKKASTA
jgi:hypothetical protein